MNDKLDIIFCSIPYTDVDHIYSAPAILKGVAMANGYKSKTVDFGMKLFGLCERDPERFANIQLHFITKNKKLSSDDQKIFDTWREDIIDYFKNNPTRYIGISILSYYTHKSALMFLKLLKDHGVETKIIAGGLGLNVRPWSGIEHEFNAIELTGTFGQALFGRKLIDKIIVGDGEDAILKALGEESTQISKRSEYISYPEPNYEDYDFKEYVKYDGELYFPITGSKGCVRDCDFCDVRYHFGKFRTRSGADIANEMLNIKKKYGFRHFQFTDSLVNGGLKPLREFCEIIAEHNDQQPEDQKILWRGQYICRPANEMPKALYPLMARAGAWGLTIGAESGSDNVLKAMNKKTNNSSLFNELEEFRKHKIKTNLLTFVGHWAETTEDFKDHCRMLIKVLPYVRSEIIGIVEFGSLAAILHGTPSMELVHSGKIIVSEFNKELLWFNNDNPMGIKERLYRRMFIHKLQKIFKFPTYNDIGKIMEMHEMILNDLENIKKFYVPYLDQIPESGSEKLFKNFDQEIVDLCREDEFNIDIDFEVDDYNGSPEMIIKLNDREIFRGSEFNKGNHQISIKNPTVGDHTKLEITMAGKGPRDTLMDNGTIVRDKFIKFNKLMINNYNMIDDPEFFRKYFRCTDGGETHLGLWGNRTMVLEFEGPFSFWYNLASDKNVKGLESKRSVSTENIMNELSELAEQLI